MLTCVPQMASCCTKCAAWILITFIAPLALKKFRSKRIPNQICRRDNVLCTAPSHHYASDVGRCMLRLRLGSASADPSCEPAPMPLEPFSGPADSADPRATHPWSAEASPPVYAAEAGRSVLIQDQRVVVVEISHRQRASHLLLRSVLRVAPLPLSRIFFLLFQKTTTILTYPTDPPIDSIDNATNPLLLFFSTPTRRLRQP